MYVCVCMCVYVCVYTYIYIYMYKAKLEQSNERNLRVIICLDAISNPLM